MPRSSDPHPPLASEPGSAAALARLFVAQALSNPANQAILQRLPALGLPDAWLVAGCLFQTVWNLRAGRPPMAGIRDYDLFYFDAGDLSAEAEDGVAARVQSACADLGVTAEVKNQARVHTWYQSYFGAPYPPLRSAMEGIDRFLVDGTCVGLHAAAEGLTVYAPDGLHGLMEGELHISRRSPDAERSIIKMRDYQQRWPALVTRAHVRAADAPPAEPLLVRGVPMMD